MQVLPILGVWHTCCFYGLWGANMKNRTSSILCFTVIYFLTNTIVKAVICMHGYIYIYIHVGILESSTTIYHDRSTLQVWFLFTLPLIVDQSVSCLFGGSSSKILSQKGWSLCVVLWFVYLTSVCMVFFSSRLRLGNLLAVEGFFWLW